MENVGSTCVVTSNSITRWCSGHYEISTYCFKATMHCFYLGNSFFVKYVADSFPILTKLSIGVCTRVDYIKYCVNTRYENNLIIFESYGDSQCSVDSTR